MKKRLFLCLTAVIILTLCSLLTSCHNNDSYFSISIQKGLDSDIGVLTVATPEGVLNMKETRTEYSCQFEKGEEAVLQLLLKSEYSLTGFDVSVTTSGGTRNVTFTHKGRSEENEGFDVYTYNIGKIEDNLSVKFSGSPSLSVYDVVMNVPKLTDEQLENDLIQNLFFSIIANKNEVRYNDRTWLPATQLRDIVNELTGGTSKIQVNGGQKLSIRMSLMSNAVVESYDAITFGNSECESDCYVDIHGENADKLMTVVETAITSDGVTADIDWNKFINAERNTADTCSRIGGIMVIGQITKLPTSYSVGKIAYSKAPTLTEIESGDTAIHFKVNGSVKDLIEKCISQSDGYSIVSGTTDMALTEESLSISSTNNDDIFDIAISVRKETPYYRLDRYVPEMDYIFTVNFPHFEK